MTYLAYPHDPTLNTYAREADAIELLEQARDILPIDDERTLEILQQVFGADIVGDPNALDEYNDAKETIAKAAELRQELAEAQEANRELKRKLAAVEWALKRAKGSKLEAVRQAIATN